MTYDNLFWDSIKLGLVIFATAACFISHIILIAVSIPDKGAKSVAIISWVVCSFSVGSGCFYYYLCRYVGQDKSAVDDSNV